MIILRQANIDDAKKILDWRNDPVVRKNSFNSDVIDWSLHLLWLEEVLKDANRYLFIILNENDVEIGQVRFDTHENEAEISITLDKNFRGRGYGTKSIKYSSEKFLKENKQLQRIIARVKTENKLSLDVFKKAGFSEMNCSNLTVYMKFEL